jgi:hypothetical protein
MVSKALLVRLEARPDTAEEVDSFLRDAFPDEGGRWEHLTGAVAKGLGKKALSLFGGIPHMNRMGVLAHKLP